MEWKQERNEEEMNHYKRMLSVYVFHLIKY